jgi:ribonuclease D
MSSIKVISDANTLSRMCDALSGAKWLSLDTEFMREKTYAPILCLLQVCSENEIFCIDSLAIDDLRPLYKLLEDSSIELILHSCRQDFEALDTVHAVNPSGLFDTQLAAAFCGLGDQVSYAALVEQVEGVKLAKSHTRANWQARPLSADELTYALDDVRYLKGICNYLKDQLARNGRTAWFEDECALQCEPNTWRVDPETAWQRLKGGARLPVEAHESAKRLAIWREHQAIKRNRPREWMLSTAALLSICKINPANVDQLGRIEGVHAGFVRHSAQAVLDILREAPRITNGDPLWTNQIVLDPAQRKQVKGVMTIIKTTAEEIGISPALLANRSMVEKFIRGRTDVDLFKGWRLDVVGQRILTNYS